MVHFNPYIKLVGTWRGDGTLDLLGDSPFDGALELTFNLDRTGYVVTEQSETAFTYDVQVHVRDIINHFQPQFFKKSLYFLVLLL